MKPEEIIVRLQKLERELETLKKEIASSYASKSAIPEREQYVLIQCEKSLCAFPVHIVEEVLPLIAWENCPEKFPYVMGFICWRDSYIPLIDLNARIKGNEFQNQWEVSDKIIITRISEKYWGFRVTDVLGIKEFSKEVIDTVVDDILTSFFAVGFVKEGSDIILILQPDALIQPFFPFAEEDTTIE